VKANNGLQDVKSKAAGTRAQSRLQENIPPGLPSSHSLPTSPVRAAVTYGNNDHDNDRRKDVVDRKSIGYAEHRLANQPSLMSKSNRRNTARVRMATGGSQRDHSQQQQREKAKTKDPADLSQIANTNNASSVLAAVEGPRAETRDAIIGLHIDLIKTSRSHKVSLHFPSVRK